MLYEENFCYYYVMMLCDWCGNFVEYWDDVVVEVGLLIVKVWGLYMVVLWVVFE